MRQKKLEQKQLEMADIVYMLNVQNEKLNNLFKRQLQTKDNLDAIYESDEELDISGISSYKNFLAKMTSDIKSQENVINNTKQILKVKQMEVTEALKEVKVLDKLKEKQEKKFYFDFQYAEGKELDDIVNTRYRVNSL